MPAEELDQQVRAILRWVLRDPDDADTAALLAQADDVTVRSGPVTWLSLDVAPGAPVAQRSERPWPRNADVVNADGDVTGGILLWLEDGRLATLEYYWMTDEPPEQLPSTNQLR